MRREEGLAKRERERKKERLLLRRFYAPSRLVAQKEGGKERKGKEKEKNIKKKKKRRKGREGEGALRPEIWGSVERKGSPCSCIFKMMMMVKATGLLCAMVLGFQAVWAQPADTSLPPEDLDSSGDDDDTFSGSGAGPLPDHPVVAWNVPLQETSNSSLMSIDLGDKQPEVQKTDSSTEDYTTVPVSSTSMAVFPVVEQVDGDDSLHSLSEQVTTRPTAVTTGTTVSHYISTVRITTSQASGTLKTLEPKVHHDVHHLPSPDKNIPASDIIPPSETTSYTTSPPTTSSTAQKDISSLPEGEVIQSEDGSGDEGDFVFSRPDESSVIEVESSLNNRAMDIPPKDEKSEGAPQGILDRKEVLGGVIAGGLVGLLFAGFLVGFMLYRMKKKDEGSYSLDEPKQSNGGYQKPHKQEEFYA